MGSLAELGLDVLKATTSARHGTGHTAAVAQELGRGGFGGFLPDGRVPPSQELTLGGTPAVFEHWSAYDVPSSHDIYLSLVICKGGPNRPPAPL